MNNNDTSDNTKTSAAQNNVSANNDAANANNDIASANNDVKLADDQSIDLFIEGLMEEKGMAEQSAQLKEDIFIDLKTRLLEQIDRSLVAALPDDKLDELSKIVAREGQVEPETVGKMVKEAGVDVEEVVGLTMAEFREIYLNGKEVEVTENGAE